MSSLEWTNFNWASRYNSAVHLVFRITASLMLFLTLVPITFVIHIAPDHVGPLFKNIALLGALAYFFTAGGGARSLSPDH